MTAWEERFDAVWADAALDDEAVIAAIDAVAADRPDTVAAEARAEFERAGARDSAGLEAAAEPLYRRALELGLDADCRPQAVIQLASTIRNLGRADESLALLQAELRDHPDAPLRDEVAAFLALALASLGEGRRAASVALTALAPHLTRYTGSVRDYAAELADPRSA